MKPYVQSNNTDGNDAAGFCEALTRPHMRFVAVKTPDQTAILMLHRVRDRLIGQRKALMNQIRGYLTEYGIEVRKGAAWLRRAIPEILEDSENGILLVAREMFADLYDKLVLLGERVTKQDRRIKAVFDVDPQCQ